MQLPHQLLQHRLIRLYDDEIRARYFRGLDFAGPEGDPGWFGPGSAVWHVHSHMPALVLGLQCAAYLERFDPSIFWMGVHHSRLVQHDEDGRPTGRIDKDGLLVRLGHSVSFFTATAYGSTADAERVTKTVRAMHHTVKGTRPDGLDYDADSADWLRWNYATVVWGIATAHEYYHPKPLRGSGIDRYYGEFVKVGHALGGTDLPATGLFGGELIDWAIRDSLPSWAAAMVMYRPPNLIERTLRQASVWAVVNGIHTTMGPLPEFRQAQKRLGKGWTGTPTSPEYTLGSDPVRSRANAEQMA
jgi:hypothetical protein